MEFRVLGAVEVGDGDLDLTPTRDKERRLLALLLSRANAVVSADGVADALWPGAEQPANVQRSVQTYVSRLRAALAPASERLVTRPPGYLVRVEPGELDADRFERLLDRARGEASDDPDSARSLLDDALALWRGPPYGEFRDEEFAVGDAVRLEELRLVAVEEHIDVRLALGHHEELVGVLEARSAEHPFRERLRAQLMVALYRSGRHAEALRAYDRYRLSVIEELGLDPSPDLRALEMKILNHDPELVLGPTALVAQAPPPVVPPISSFVGRDGEVAEVLRRLGATRLLTLTGPGGVGKTRLALEVASTAAATFPDGVTVFELAGVTDADAVAPAVATALGIQPRAGRSVEASIADVLQARELLLVVDNCEHVIDAAASLLMTIVRRCPRVAVLATSRERLGIDGERLWPLAPLDQEAAVELFYDRAIAVRPGLNPDGDARADVIEICRRLDGLPLAIELAAAQVAAMNPGDLAHRLDDRFGLLDRGARGAPGRHRSLRAAVDSSYERLDEPERRLFDRLAVFAGSFTLAAAEEVCSGDGVERGDVARLMAALVDGSLVVLVGDGDRARYRLLETLRSYGLGHLGDEGVEDRWRDRHLDHCIRLAIDAEVGLRGSDERRWMAELDASFDDLRAAHRRAATRQHAESALRLTAALHGYGYRSMRPELFAWAETAARLPTAAGSSLLPRALGSAATGAWARGDLAAAERLAREAVDLTPEGDPAAHLAYAALAGTALFRGQLDRARADSRRAADLAAADGDAYLAFINEMVENLAVAYAGDTDGAVDRAERTLAAARTLECPSLTAWGMYHLGETLIELAPDRALALLDEAEALAAGVGHTFLMGVAGTSATTLRARNDDPAATLGRFTDLIDLWYRIGNWTQQWTMLRSLIVTLVRLGDDETAAALLARLQISPTAPPLFGADERRLAEARRSMEARVGPDQLEAWLDRGRRSSDDDVIELARTATSAR